MACVSVVRHRATVLAHPPTDHEDLNVRGVAFELANCPLDSRYQGPRRYENIATRGAIDHVYVQHHPELARGLRRLSPKYSGLFGFIVITGVGTLHAAAHHLA